MAKRKQQAANRMIGRFVVADPAICHGQPTFRGTRILVADVLEQVAAGMSWETIVQEWRDDVSADAISEAVRLASQAFRDHSGQYAAQEYVLERVHAPQEAADIFRKARNNGIGTQAGRQEPGRQVDGLYPNVSRTKLALALGVHKSTVTGIFNGRTEPGLALASRVAALIGVRVEQLNVDLRKRQKARRKARWNE